MNKVKIAVIGAGTISEIMHLPALLQMGNVELTAIVDINTNRLDYLSNKFNIPNTYQNYNDCINKFDAAIIATSNNTHKQITEELLKKKKHLLIEKPLAATINDCQSIVELTNDNKDIIVSVGQIKRFYENFRFIKKIIENNQFGKLKSIQIEDGRVFSYPMSSDFFLKKDKSGGGVLIDVGIHFLDLVYWWVGDLNIIKYKDDAVEGGVEADCELQATSATGVDVNVLLSRQRVLNNNVVLQFEHITLSIPANFSNEITFHLNDAEKIHAALNFDKQTQYLFNNIKQIESFINAIQGNKSDIVKPYEASKIMRYIFEAYSKKEIITYEWE